jgi:hypothetical protein
LAWLKPKRGHKILKKFTGADTPHYLIYSPPARKPAGTNSDVFAKQKRKAAEWQGCHSAAAQGIERKYRRPPPAAGVEELER